MAQTAEISKIRFEELQKNPIFFLKFFENIGAPDKPCGVGRADANPKLLLNDT